MKESENRRRFRAALQGDPSSSASSGEGQLFTWWRKHVALWRGVVVTGVAVRPADTWRLLTVELTLTSKPVECVAKTIQSDRIVAFRFTSVADAVLNLLADILYIYANPRLRVSS